ncbi:MAG: hypothetical protein J6C13_01100 [Clostridia bacterium]|nr:hypothetical protein [Clostridia bacterium]
MFADEEKIKKVQPDEIYDDFEDDYYDDEEEVVQKPVKTQKERVTIEDPKDGIKFEPTLNNFCVLFSLISVALMVLARMFMAIGVGVCFTIFYWIGAAVLLGAIAVYVVQIIQAKAVKFEPQLIILILAIFCGCGVII